MSVLGLGVHDASEAHAGIEARTLLKERGPNPGIHQEVDSLGYGTPGFVIGRRVNSQLLAEWIPALGHDSTDILPMNNLFN